MEPVEYFPMISIYFEDFLYRYKLAMEPDTAVRGVELVKEFRKLLALTT